jgi:glycosyltransferase involved in cell wall biosynthesis
MRILMIAHGFPPTFGGVESHLWDISTRIAGHGHTVCCLVGGEQCSREILGNISVIRQPNLTVRSLLASRLGLAPSTISGDLLNDLARTVSDTVEEFAPTCIHIHNSHHFAPELALALFTQVRGIPLINGVHDRVGEYLFEEVIRYSWDHVLYASNYLSKSIPTHCPSSVLWLGIDLAQFSPQGRAR